MIKYLKFILLLLLCGTASAYPYEEIITRHAKQYNVDPMLVKAVIRQESGFRDKVISPAGANGLMQLMPGTAKRFGVSMMDVFKPERNIEAGTRYLAWLLKRFNGNVQFALAGYNAGEGKVDKYKGIPPYKETRNYVKRVTHFYTLYKSLKGINKPSKGRFLKEKSTRQFQAYLKKTSKKPIMKRAVAQKTQIKNNRPIKVASSKKAILKSRQVPSRIRSLTITLASNTTRIRSLTITLASNTRSGFTRIRSSKTRHVQ